MKARKSISILAAAAAVASMSAFVMPAANAADADGDIVTSSRSFKGQESRSTDLLKESTSVSVKDDSNYGGIESLNVPQTESQAEKDAKAAAAAAAAAQAAQEQARQQAAQRAAAASRSSARTSTSSKAAAPMFDASAVTAPTSASGAAVVSYASQFLGVPYVYGGTTPAGFDCSGFTSYVYRQFGLNIGRTDADQHAYAVANGTQVSNPEPGDLMWKAGHVGIYVGNGQMIHAPKPGDSVKIAPVYSSAFQYYRILK